MSDFLARCVFLRALLADLMGDAGRKITLLDESDQGLALPKEGRTWVPWVSDPPDKSTSYILAESEPIAHVVRTMKMIRDALAKGCSGSTMLRESCRMYFEGAIIRREWIGPGGLEDGTIYTGRDPQGEPFPVYEYTLTTLPAPLAKLDGLFMLVKALALDCEREDDKVNDWLERTTPEPEKRNVGRKPLHEQPKWLPAIARILSLEEEGVKFSAIAETMNTEYPELERFNEERVRGIRNRELNRLKKKPAV